MDSIRTTLAAPVDIITTITYQMQRVRVNQIVVDQSDAIEGGQLVLRNVARLPMERSSTFDQCIKKTVLKLPITLSSDSTEKLTRLKYCRQ